MYENEDKLKSMYESAEAFFDEEDKSDGVWYQQTMIHAAVIQAESLVRIADALERLAETAENAGAPNSDEIWHTGTGS